MEAKAEVKASCHEFDTDQRPFGIYALASHSSALTKDWSVCDEGNERTRGKVELRSLPHVFLYCGEKGISNVLRRGVAHQRFVDDLFVALQGVVGCVAT